MKDKLVQSITIMVTVTLCLVVISMVGALVAGLFTPNVDNEKIFEAISPAFQTIIGGFIGLITGIKIGSGEE